MRVFVYGTPYPWRTAQRRRNGGTYRHPKTAAWQADVYAQVLALKPEKFPEGVRLEAEVLVFRPPSHYLKGGGLKKAAPRYPITLATGDTTNHFKAIEDACKGLLYRDDSQVIDEAASLRYADRNAATGAWITATEVP